MKRNASPNRALHLLHATANGGLRVKPLCPRWFVTGVFRKQQKYTIFVHVKSACFHILFVLWLNTKKQALTQEGEKAPSNFYSSVCNDEYFIYICSSLNNEKIWDYLTFFPKRKKRT